MHRHGVQLERHGTPLTRYVEQMQRNAMQMQRNAVQMQRIGSPTVGTRLRALGIGLRAHVDALWGVDRA